MPGANDGIAIPVSNRRSLFNMAWSLADRSAIGDLACALTRGTDPQATLINWCKRYAENDGAGANSSRFDSWMTPPSFIAAGPPCHRQLVGGVFDRLLNQVTCVKAIKDVHEKHASCEVAGLTGNSVVY